MKYDPKTYGRDIARLEVLEAEAWFDYERAERWHEDVKDLRGYKDEAYRAKARVTSLLFRHRGIMRDIMFLHCSHVLSHPRRMRGAGDKRIIETTEEVMSLAQVVTARDSKPDLEASALSNYIPSEAHGGDPRRGDYG